MGIQLFIIQLIIIIIRILYNIFERIQSILISIIKHRLRCSVQRKIMSMIYGVRKEIQYLKVIASARAIIITHHFSKDREKERGQI